MDGLIPRSESEAIAMLKLIRPPFVGLFAGIVLVLAAACGADSDAVPPAQPDPPAPSPAEQAPAQQSTDEAAASAAADPAEQADEAEDTATVASTPGFEDSVCETQVGDGVPEFYRRYFRCAQIDLDGDSVRIQSDGQPPHRSYYYGEDSALFEPFDFSRGADYRPNPNGIGGTGFVLRIPVQPVEAGRTVDAASVNALTGDATDSPFGVAGVALDGVALFNPLAAPGDDIEDEKFSFDSYAGHPEQRGTYHYHAVSPGPLAVLQSLGFTTTSIPGAGGIELYGIMCDGTVVMGELELDGSAVAADLDAQSGHAHDLVAADGVVLLTNRYHVHIAAEIGLEPRGLTPEAQFYGACAVS